MKQSKDNSHFDVFTERKLKLVNGLLPYYSFLRQNDEDALAEDPIQ